MLVLALATLIGFAPAIITHTPLLQAVLSRVLGGFPGTVRIGHATLGWLQPPVFDDIAVVDRGGQPLLTAEQIAGSKSLLALVLDHRNLGEFRVAKPKVHAVCKGQSSNLEDAIFAWLSAQPKQHAPVDAQSSMPSLKVTVVDGEVTIHDEDTTRDSAITGLQGEFTLGTYDAAMQARLSGVIADGPHAEPITVELTQARASTQAQGHFDVTGFPLGALTPLIRRFEATTVLAGRLTGKLDGTWDEKTGDMHLAGPVSAQELTVRGRWAPQAAGLTSRNLSGDINLEQTGHKIIVKTNLTAQDLICGKPAAPLWHESRVQLAGQLSYDGSNDAIRFEQVQVATPALSAVATGQLARLSTTQDLIVNGRLQYDLKQLEPSLQLHLGPNTHIEGRDTRPFRLVGSLASTAPVTVQVGQPAAAAPGLLARMNGQAELSWKSIQAFGLTVGPAEIQAGLASGWLRVKPIETTVNGGKLRLAPLVRLEPEPVEIYLEKGARLERLQLTSASCAGALGYALPVLAEAIQAEGQVSIAVDYARVPVANPAAADIGGQVIIHSSRIVTGPLIQELAVLLRAPAQATLGQEAVVPVRLVNGRVYHRDLQLIFPDLTIRTQGSVGLDGSLDLLAEMPIPPKWAGSKPLGQLVSRQTIRLPIRGSLAKPKLDEQALRAALAQSARDAAGDAVRQQIDKQFNRLLQPR